MKKKHNISKTYSTSILLLFAFGFLWTLANYELEILRFLGLLMAVGACMVINLLFFLPLSMFFRILLPAIISSFIFLFLIQGSSVERRFFTVIGIINGIVDIGLLFFNMFKQSGDK